ncbi:MAG: CRISPR-associated endonuclease Cas2 [Thiotrichales bacterium]|nr:CRISPR-associated endonuclease Cas2 [Thiotrichales bacterium]MBD3799295.1 CRISPR-associated endonuclease Cas2 [Campylobacterota bacterium]
MKHYIICFDIQDDKIRAKLSRLLDKYGLRVQGSVFEVSFKNPDRKRLLEYKIKQLLKKSQYEETNVRFYNLSKETLKYCHDINGNPIAQPAAVVIL